MILAGLVLSGIGGVDLVRRFVRRRGWIGLLVVLVLVAALGVGAGAIAAAVAAVLLTVAWMLSVPVHPRSPNAFWPAVLLAVVCAAAVAFLGERAPAGVIGAVWDVASPAGPVSFDVAVLAVGVMVFLLESSNLVVRAALSGERMWVPADERVDDSADVVAGAGPGAPAGPEASTASEPPAPGGFVGGRLIGPLERVLVFLLTLVPAYPLLAAMLAAKGIVRFPEISRRGETGARAEYFLVGSMVSWVCALAGALLVWWAAHV